MDRKACRRMSLRQIISGCRGCKVVLMMSGATVQEDGGEPIDGSPLIYYNVAHGFTGSAA